MKKRIMQPTEQAEYRLPQDFCCANKTVLNCPSSSADTFNVYYNYSSPSLPTADKTYDSYFDWDNATQELFLDVEGVINLQYGYQFSSVYNNSIHMCLVSNTHVEYYDNPIVGTSAIKDCFKQSDTSLYFSFPKEWYGYVPTRRLDIDETAELICEFTLCFHEKNTGKIVKCPFTFNNTIDTTSQEKNKCHTPKLVMLWGPYNC